MSFVVGDIVRIRDYPLEQSGPSGYYMTRTMQDFVGRELVISRVSHQNTRNGEDVYGFDEVGRYLWFDEEMLELVHSCRVVLPEESTRTCSVCGTPLSSHGYRVFNGAVVCDECYRGIENAIHNYHDKTSWAKKVGLQKSRLWSNLMGFELEVDCYRESNDVKSLYAYNIAKKTDRLMFIERDGSIDNGFEIISEPMDMQWLREGGKDKIEAMFDYINQDDVNIREHDSCGLHVHVDRDCLVTTSRTHEEVVDNIYLIVETFKNELIKFSRRYPNSYCRYLTSDSDGDLSLRKVKRVKNRRRGDRYIAINNTNTNTVEFRMFSSTKSYETLMATLEMVNNIVNIAKYKNIDGLTWANLVNYQSSKNEFLNNYVKSLNINSDTSISLVDEFERNVNNYSLRKFLDGEFVINCNCGEVEDINKPSFLLPLLLSNKVTYFSNAYDSMLNCLQRKIFNEEVICVRMCGEDNRLVSYRESYNIEHSANLDEIIELWIENPELMR